MNIQVDLLRIHIANLEYNFAPKGYRKLVNVIEC
jgi:hypothetical protein